MKSPLAVMATAYKLRLHIMRCSVCRASSIFSDMACSHAKYLIVRIAGRYSMIRDIRMSVAFIARVWTLDILRAKNVGRGKHRSMTASPAIEDHPSIRYNSIIAIVSSIGPVIQQRTMSRAWMMASTSYEIKFAIWPALRFLLEPAFGTCGWEACCSALPWPLFADYDSVFSSSIASFSSRRIAL